MLWLAGCGPGSVAIGEPLDTAVETFDGCGLSVDGTELFSVEGERVRVDVSCASGAPVSRVGPGEIEDGTWSWRPDLDEAGVHDVLFSHGLESAVVRVHVADAWDEGGNEPVDPWSYTTEYGLPVMHLLPEGSLSEEYVAATIVFEGREYIGARVKYRGAASLYYPKVGYTLDFDSEDQMELSDRGMGDKAHLVLISTFDDNTYIRQSLAYGLWADMAEHFDADRLTVRTFPTVVYMNGEYVGLYTAADHVDDEFLGQMGLDRDSPLFKAVNHNANFFGTDYYGNAKSVLWDGYDLKEGDSWASLEALVAWSSTASDAELVATAEDWIDPTEFMDWFLFVHFTESGDSAGKNSYLAWDLLTERMRYAPWDFNHSWGQDWRTLRIGPESYNAFTGTNRIFKAQQAADSERLWERWWSLVDEGPFREEHLLARADALWAEVDPSAARDWDRWGSAYRSYSGWSSRGDFNDYEGEREYLVDWIRHRCDWAVEAHDR